MKRNEPTLPWLDASQLKQEISLETVLRHYGLLERLNGHGSRLRGLSPFREETKPSFFVDLDKGVWNDFPRPEVMGKTAPGNIFGLVMAMENCDFRTALVLLSERCSGHREQVQAALEESSKVPGEGSEESADVHTSVHTDVQMMELIPVSSESEEGVAQASAHSSMELPQVNEPFGKELRGLRFDVPYLQEKGIDESRARYWRTGYCSRGMMKGRIVVPIKNRHGAIMAYAGRSLKEDDPEGKWKLPKGFSKSLELFNVDKVAGDRETREAVAKHGLIIVEGFLDVISLSENGYKNVVALMGTELSQVQAAMLVDPELNPSRRLTLFLDEDDAGKRGRKKAAATLIHDAFVRYVDTSCVELGGRTDPDEFSAEELKQFLV